MKGSARRLGLARGQGVDELVGADQAEPLACQPLDGASIGFDAVNLVARGLVVFEEREDFFFEADAFALNALQAEIPVIVGEGENTTENHHPGGDRQDGFEFLWGRR